MYDKEIHVFGLDLYILQDIIIIKKKNNTNNLLKENNISGANASLTYGPKLQRQTCFVIHMQM